MNADQYARQHEKEQIEKLRKQVRQRTHYVVYLPGLMLMRACCRLLTRRLSLFVAHHIIYEQNLTPSYILQEQLQKQHDELHKDTKQ